MDSAEAQPTGLARVGILWEMSGLRSAARSQSVRKLNDRPYRNPKP